MGRVPKNEKALSNAEKQAAYRARKKEQQLIEVRGIFIPDTPEAKQKIMEVALELRRTMPNPPPEDLII